MLCRRLDVPCQLFSLLLFLLNKQFCEGSWKGIWFLLWLKVDECPFVVKIIDLTLSRCQPPLIRERERERDVHSFRSSLWRSKEFTSCGQWFWKRVRDAKNDFLLFLLLFFVVSYLVLDFSLFWNPSLLQTGLLLHARMEDMLSLCEWCSLPQSLWWWCWALQLSLFSLPCSLSSVTDCLPFLGISCGISVEITGETKNIMEEASP